MGFKDGLVTLALICLCILGSWAQEKKNQEEKKNYEKTFVKNPDKVQLWEGGPYWANRNIGAEKPWEYGYYFWWGDTIGYKYENGAWVASNGSSYNFSFGSENAPTFPQALSALQSEGWITSGNVLAPEHDAAQVHWGKTWRMPTSQEMSDLNSKCDWTWISLMNGYVVRGRGAYASHCIFLPCAGCGKGTSHRYASCPGRYWSSVPYSDNYRAWSLCFDSNEHGTSNGDRRYRGQSVRPVQGFTR